MEAKLNEFTLRLSVINTKMDWSQAKLSLMAYTFKIS